MKYDLIVVYDVSDVIVGVVVPVAVDVPVCVCGCWKFLLLQLL